MMTRPEAVVQISPRCPHCSHFGCSTPAPSTPKQRVWIAAKNVAGFLAVMSVAMLAAVGFLTIGTALAWHHLFG